MKNFVKRRIAGILQKDCVRDHTIRGIQRLFRIAPAVAQPWRPEREGPGAVWALTLEEKTEKLLNGIPSETSPNERRFLYQIFRAMWSGNGDVIEIGPFLGGTTQAIARGMCANPRRSGTSRLLTFDQFHSYYDAGQLRTLLQPLFANGRLQEADLEQVGERVAFLTVFQRIHKNTEYWPVVCPQSWALPDTPPTDSAPAPAAPWAPDLSSDAVFVDGCKSWYATKYFMTSVASVTRPGCLFIFQDYGWYTCFWISAFVHLLKDHFALLASVDTTYAYMLESPLDAAAIDAVFPDTPAQLGQVRLTALFDDLIVQAERRRDHYAVVRHTMHKAASLAYVGDKAAAKQLLLMLLNEPAAYRHTAFIRDALKSPTYSPSGPIMLDPGD